MREAGGGRTGATLFVSDVHLSPARPSLIEAFLRFLSGPARAVESLYVLGDLFDVWLGDDQLREPFAADLAAHFHALADSGVHIGLVRGNRDFLLGEDFARATGGVFLPEQSVIDAQGTPTLVMHGDELCTGDTSYQRLRSFMRARSVQRTMLALPYAVRRGVAGSLRRHSVQATASKPESIMDVAPDAVAAALRAHRVARMVHGHTHRPGRHESQVDGRICERWVLADWYTSGSYLECTPAGMRMRDVPAE